MTPGADTVYEHLRLENAGDVLRVIIDVPGDPLNTIGPGLHQELVTMFGDLRTHCDARAVMLSARGRLFSAGGDIKRLMPRLQDPREREHIRRATHQLLGDVLDLPVPVIAAVGGDAVGLAANLVLLCDVVVMSRDARLIDPHISVGLVPGDGGVMAWTLTLGHVLAKRYLLTGDPLPAEDALRCGLVTELADREDVDDIAIAWARRLAAGPTVALRDTKLAINGVLRSCAQHALEQSIALEALSFDTDDHREAVAAHSEKRKPHFRGR